MKHKSFLLIVLMALFLVACGGGDDSVPTPTPEPTLTVEERIQHPAGSDKNPFLMAIYPVDTVGQRVFEVIVNEHGFSMDALAADLAVAENLVALNLSLERDFMVTLEAVDVETVNTIDDLIYYVHMQLGQQVSTLLFERTSLYVDIVIVDSYGEALTDLCASDIGIVSIPWLDGVSYTAAVAQRCGQPALQVAVANVRPDEFAETIEVVVQEEPTEVVPEETAEATTEVDGADAEEATPTAAPTDEPEVVETPDAEDEAPVEITLTVGDAGLVIANRAFSSSSIFLVQDRIFCRLGHGDFYSWLLPSLIMLNSDMNPYTAPAEIVDYDDIPSLVQAVADGDCDASGISQSTFDALEDTRGISIIETTIDFPYGIFMYPLQVELGIRLSFTEDMIEFADDPQVSRPLRLLLGQDAIVEVLPGDLDELDEFMLDTDLDFAQMGD